MRDIVQALAIAATLCVGVALAQPAPAPAPLDDPWREAFQKASPVVRAQMLLAKPAWDEDLKADASVMLVSDPDGRDVLLRATRDASVCRRVTASVAYLRTEVNSDTADGEHYWYEGTYTQDVIGKLQAAATSQAACATTTAEVEAFAADRVAWAASRPGQQKRTVRVTNRATPSTGTAASEPPRTSCPPGPVSPTMRAICDPATIEANRRTNETIYGRPSAARDACYKALEDEMRRTNNRVANFSARYEACRRIN